MKRNQDIHQVCLSVNIVIAPESIGHPFDPLVKRYRQNRVSDLGYARNAQYAARAKSPPERVPMTLVPAFPI